MDPFLALFGFQSSESAQDAAGVDTHEVVLDHGPLFGKGLLCVHLQCLGEMLDGLLQVPRPLPPKPVKKQILFGYIG